MKIKEVMRTRVVTISETSSYEQAITTMRRHRFSGLPVVNSDGAMVGIISEKDLFKAVYPQYMDFVANPELYHDHEEQEARVNAIRHSQIKEHMTRNVITVGPDTPVMRAGGIMLAHGVNRLPVVENGELVGIVTRTEIFSALFSRHLGIHESIAMEHVSPESSRAAITPPAWEFQEVIKLN